MSSGETAAQSIDVQSVGGGIHHTAEVGSTGVTGPEYVVLVQSMGGSIVAESEVGRGTRFVIDLPAA